MSNEEEEHYRNCHTLLCDYFKQENLEAHSIIGILSCLLKHACSCSFLSKKDMKILCDKISEGYIPMFEKKENPNE